MAPSAAPIREIRSFATQLRIVFSNLQKQNPSSSAAGTRELQAIGREYAAQMYMLMSSLVKARDEAPMGDDEQYEELQAEAIRTQWAVCVWELAMIVFVAHPAVITERFVQWWHRHLWEDEAQEVDSLMCMVEPDDPGQEVGTKHRHAARTAASCPAISSAAQTLPHVPTSSAVRAPPFRAAA